MYCTMYCIYIIKASCDFLEFQGLDVERLKKTTVRTHDNRNNVIKQALNPTRRFNLTHTNNLSTKPKECIINLLPSSSVSLRIACIISSTGSFLGSLVPRSPPYGPARSGLLLLSLAAARLPQQSKKTQQRRPAHPCRGRVQLKTQTGPHNPSRSPSGSAKYLTRTHRSTHPQFPRLTLPIPHPHTPSPSCSPHAKPKSKAYPTEPFGQREWRLIIEVREHLRVQEDLRNRPESPSPRDGSRTP